jgi:hypothetical protein
MDAVTAVGVIAAVVVVGGACALAFVKLVRRP